MASYLKKVRKGQTSKECKQRFSGVAQNALDVVFIGAVGLQNIASVADVLVGNKHGKSDAKSEGCHDEQKLLKVEV